MHRFQPCRRIPLSLPFRTALIATLLWPGVLQAVEGGATSLKPTAPAPLQTDQAAVPIQPVVAPTELVVSLNRASLEIVDVSGTNFALEAFQVEDDQVVRVDAAADFPLWREGGTLCLELPSLGRPGLVYRLRVPQATSLNLQSSEGHVTVAEHTGRLRVSTSVGSIHLGRIAGELEAHASAGDVWLKHGGAGASITTSGGRMTLGEIVGAASLGASGGFISLGQVHGDLTARSSGGAITVGRAGASVLAQSSGGDITVNFTRPPTGTNLLKASGGELRVTLPPQANCRIAARGDGEVESDLPIEWRDEREGYRRGLLNVQGATLTLRTSGGRVHLHGFDEKTAPSIESVRIKSASELPKLNQSRPVLLVVRERAGGQEQAARTRRENAAREPVRIEPEDSVWQGADWKPVKMLAAGLWLQAGRWVEAEVLAVDDIRVEFRGAGASKETLQTSQVRAILFDRVPDTRQELIERGRRGVLLKNGDFFEGEFRLLEQDQVTVSSALFGLRKFALKTEVVGLVLRGE